MEECSLFLEKNKASVEREVVFDAGGGFFLLMKVMTIARIYPYMLILLNLESKKIGLQTIKL